tara:strand:- start:601 stop:900 length:300 start_codon:yes stop_codon:yes gene_type:complete
MKLQTLSVPIPNFEGKITMEVIKKSYLYDFAVAFTIMGEETGMTRGQVIDGLFDFLDLPNVNEEDDMIRGKIVYGLVNNHYDAKGLSGIAKGLRPRDRN